MVILNESGQWSRFNRKIHQFGCVKFPQKGHSYKKPTANLLVFLLTKQTNVWICAAEQVLLSIVSKFCFRQSLAC